VATQSTQSTQPPPAGRPRRPSDVERSTLLLTVLGPGGRADLAVPPWLEVGAVAQAYAAEVGLADAPALGTTAGRRLDASTTLEHSGLQQGDVLAALDPSAPADTAPPPADGSLHPVARVLLPAPARLVLLVAAAVCGLGAAALAVALPGDASLRPVLVAGLLVGAAVAAYPFGGLRATGARGRTAAAPAFGAAAGFAVACSTRPGGLLLGLAVAGLGAVVVAAVARAWLEDAADDLVGVWLVVGSVVALAAAAMLLLDAPLTGLLSVLFAAAVVAARLLPFVVVDVPDDALLDLDQLAVTAWSAREQPRGRRRRTVVRREGVAEVVGRGQRLVSAGTVVISVLVATTGAVLVTGAGGDVAGVGALVMVGLGGAGLALVARSFRAVVPRLALRFSSAWVLAWLGVELLRDRGPEATWYFFAGAMTVAFLVVVAAVSLGRGWRSVWWARVADVTEALAIVLVVAAAPVASGLFGAIRVFTS
jgi:hypothetical protein